MTISAYSNPLPGHHHHEIDQPQLIFFTELDASALLSCLRMPSVLQHLSELQASVALAFPDLHPHRIKAAKILQAHGIPCVAWLCLKQEEGIAFNLTNYPRAIGRYEALSQWLKEEEIEPVSVGFTIKPPIAASNWGVWGALRAFARGLWLARDNALYPAARDAYIELVNAIRRDGHEAHVYYMPLVADDQRVGTTLIQRALDIVDLPADVDVLLCSSKIPVRWLGGDLGGALVASYGPVSDAIGVGAVDLSYSNRKPLGWPQLRRDILLAAQHTDTIYIMSLEHCIRNGLLESIRTLDWNAPAQAIPSRTALVSSMRAILLLTLLIARYGRVALAWLGWLTALILWLRGRDR